MFEDLKSAPPDAILGLSEGFRADPREAKVNLTVGVYQDEAGQTPVLATVREAALDLLEAEKTKQYLPIPGRPELGLHIRELLFGAGDELVSGGRAVTAQTPGGTGALRIAGDFLCKSSSPTLWLSAPTWPNHPAVFAAAGLETRTYPYFSAATGELDREAFLNALREVPAGDVVVLHGCCHNPTGVDPDFETWQEIAGIAAERGWLPLVDLAYQGFGEGIEEDVRGLRELAARVPELLVCSSFSKTFGLYRERIGALTLVAQTPGQASAVLSQLKVVIRTSYSNPPAHGGEIVSLVLGDAERRARWQVELETMRARIHGMRVGLADALTAAGASRDFSFLAHQKGMFSLLGISKAQVDALRDDHAIYLVGSGRINVAGLTPANLEAVARALVSTGA
ncbi:MAG: amino acid aminotransferase [Deltaproteobacteria bacterium]